MGWYHSTQLLAGEVPRARLGAVVEPWFMGEGSGAEHADSFAAFRSEAEAEHGVKFCASVEELPSAVGPRVALIAARAADFPPLFSAVLQKGFDHIYLEKPGAPDAATMAAMADAAQSAGVPVSLGFNKNVSSYVAQAREFAASHPGTTSTLVHNNDYSDATLDECFERNSNGMLHNMVIHELALLVTYYRVTAANISSVEINRDLTLRETRGAFTDFRRLAFTITTEAGDVVSVEADRCGGNNSQVVVKEGSEERFRAIMPDPTLQAEVDAKLSADPEMSNFGYFFTQHHDYVTIKRGVVEEVLAGRKGSPEGVATIAMGVETLRLAEFLKETIEAQLTG